ncbi:hypothetical protein DUNSADRAFT_10475 [Dunaliella salina]|uniref:Encoded protein n=1 Tax=Dunaliella salina TaxID=3046 RepID=A0ABQ7GF93_DUNSA|nr:hypothetical protein DUNSADRAFT_10475 [Dunaliella salina]|eukprot:KAF5833275.1 hypothetical protein DUNSADRAFT_10475 [Dunaliella salina]
MPVLAFRFCDEQQFMVSFNHGFVLSSLNMALSASKFISPRMLTHDLCVFFAAALCFCRIQMLDTVRYLVVWNPLIFMALSFAFHFMAPPSVLPHDQGIHADTLHDLGQARNATHHLMPPPMNGTVLH